MNNAFNVAELVCKDLGQKAVASKPGWCGGDGEQIVTWDRWLRIDKEETARGQVKGKPREKIVDVQEMLKVAGY
jgi:adrenodoxin-NADP+ reductase